MTKAPAKGSGAIGAIFLALAVFKFVSGGDWIVWVILGLLFGGFGFIGARLGKQKHEEGID